MKYVVFITVATLCSGCSDSQTPVTDTSGRNDIRIVSFSPAISRTLVDFELDDLVVARTPHCESLDSTIPVVGDLINVNYEQLIRLKPTHLLVQPPTTGIDEGLRDLANSRGWTLATWQLNTIDDIETMIREIPGAVFESHPDRQAAAARKAAELLNKFATALTPGPEPLFTGRVLMVNAVEPVMAFGTQTYLHDILVVLGGKNAINSKGWVQLSLEDVTRINPDAVIIVKPGADPSVSISEHAGPLASMHIRAIKDNRVALLNHVDAFLPSSALADVASELRSILVEFHEGER